MENIPEQPEQTPFTITYSTTSRGRPELIVTHLPDATGNVVVESFYIKRIGDTRNDRGVNINWVCCSTKPQSGQCDIGCKGSCSTRRQDPTVNVDTDFKRIQDHDQNCQVTKNRRVHRQMRNEIYRRATSGEMTQTRSYKTVVNEFTISNPDAAATFTNLESARASISSQVRAQRPPQIAIENLNDLIIPPKYGMIPPPVPIPYQVGFDPTPIQLVLHKENFQNLVTHEIYGFVVIGTKPLVMELADNQTVAIDATFKTAPKPFHQVLHIAFYVAQQGVQGEKRAQFVALRILMSHKNQILYNRVFEWVLNYCHENGHEPPYNHNLDVAWQHVMMDFEPALRNAVALTFNNFNLHIHACYYHFMQIVWRRIQRLKLTTLYRNNEVFRRIILKFRAIPFLPEERVIQGYNALRNVSFFTLHDIILDNPQYTSKFDEIFKLFRYYYYDPARRAQCNVFELDANRTNNFLEGHHNRLINRMKKRSDFWVYLEKVRDETLTQMTKRQQIRAGAAIKTKEPKYRRKEDFIRTEKFNLTLAFQQPDINGAHNNAILTFLNNICYQIGNIHNPNVPPPNQEEEKEAPMEAQEEEGKEEEKEQEGDEDEDEDEDEEDDEDEDEDDEEQEEFGGEEEIQQEEEAEEEDSDEENKQEEDEDDIDHEGEGQIQNYNVIEEEHFVHDIIPQW